MNDIPFLLNMDTWKWREPTDADKPRLTKREIMVLDAGFNWLAARISPAEVLALRNKVYDQFSKFVGQESKENT